MPKKKELRGGPRPGSGRKPSADPKKGIWIYVPSSQVEKVGGIEPAKRIAEMAISIASKAPIASWSGPLQ